MYCMYCTTKSAAAVPNCIMRVKRSQRLHVWFVRKEMILIKSDLNYSHAVVLYIS